MTKVYAGFIALVAFLLFTLPFAGSAGASAMSGPGPELVLAQASQDITNSSQNLPTMSKKPPPPKASFTASPTSGQAPLTVHFNNTSTGTITSFIWDFGDGQSSTQQNPTHVYQNNGYYTATLVVIGPGGTSTKTVAISVLPPKPKANFTAIPTSGRAPLTVRFTDTSTGVITRYFWSFGDGSSSSAQNPGSHVYRMPGFYTITLTVTGPGGTDSETTRITVDRR